jgi:hypothetical protein
MLDGIAFSPKRHVRCVGLFAAHSLNVTGPDPETEAALRQERVAPRDATGLRRANCKTYAVHIPPGHQPEWLNEDTARALVKCSDTVFARHLASLQVIEPEPNAFCSFAKIPNFEPLRRLV